MDLPKEQRITCFDCLRPLQCLQWPTELVEVAGRGANQSLNQSQKRGSAIAFWPFLPFHFPPTIRPFRVVSGHCCRLPACCTLASGTLWHALPPGSIVPNMVVGNCCSRCHRLYAAYCRCRRLYTGVWVGLALLLADPYSTTTAVNAFNGFVGRVPSTAESSSSPTLRFDAHHFEGWR